MIVALTCGTLSHSCKNEVESITSQAFSTSSTPFIYTLGERTQKQY